MPKQTNNIIFKQEDIKAAQAVIYNLIKNKLHRKRQTETTINTADLNNAIYHVASNPKFAKRYQNFDECKNVLNLCYNVILNNKNITLIQKQNTLYHTKNNQNKISNTFNKITLLKIKNEISQSLNTQLELFN